MDPNELLKRLLELSSEVLSDRNSSDDADELAEGIQNLDNWISHGGFLPKRWSK